MGDVGMQDSIRDAETPMNTSKNVSNETVVKINPVPKSWAALVSSNAPETQQVPSSKPHSIPPFVMTSQQDKEQKEHQKLLRLGEILLSRKLMKMELDHRTLYLVLRGMINRGNACYANAVLQSLVFCPPFYHLMESIAASHEFSQFIDGIPAVTKCFVELVGSFKKISPATARQSPTLSQGSPVDPGFVYETLEQHGPGSQMLSHRTQEDAQEFLNHTLLLLHEEMVRGFDAAGGREFSQEINGASDEWTRISKGQRKSILRETEIRESPISNIFGGKLRSIRLKQNRLKDSENVEPFFCLDLPIQDPDVRNVFGSIERFMKSEKIHGFVDRGREIDAFRLYRFEQLPAVLILHLKYFEFSCHGGLAKLQKPIDFEPNLKLPDRWFVDGHYQPTKSFYRLSAVVFHWGEQLDSGHYTACLFHPGIPSQWIEANDSAINVVNFEYIRSPQQHRVPYLLFYRLQNSE